MKNIFIHSILFKLSLLLIHAQQNIGISMGTSYQYDIYYSIDNGITATPLRDNWDISFQINSNFGNMRINSGEGIILYKIDSSIHDFENINGIDPSFVRYRNSNTKWEDGAFIADGEILNNDLYILISGNNIKKMKVNYDSGLYSILHSNLDGSSTDEIVINSDDYQNKKFIYYSFNLNEILDREPHQDNWDLLFTKYETDLNNDNPDPFFYESPYFVSGVLTNSNLSAQHEGNIMIYPEFLSLDTTRNINIIGWDWKVYSGTFTIVDDRSYYIKKNNFNEVYQLKFNSFSGMSSGNVSFNLTQTETIEPLSNKLYIVNQIKLYPNPCKSFLNLKSNILENIDYKIFDFSGKEIYSGNFYNSNNINLEGLNSGNYIIEFVANNEISRKTFIIAH